MPIEETEVIPADQPPEDYAAYEKWANDRQDPTFEVEPEAELGEESETPEETPEVESAEESETSTDEEQEETEEDEDDKPKGKGVQKRISKLTKEIRELKAALQTKEPKPEPAVPKSDEKQDAKDGKPVAPKLADFESYELYEAAHAEFVEALTDYKADQKEATRKAEEVQNQHVQAQAQRDREWAEAAKEYPDFNDVVSSEDVKISAAMEATMKLSSDGVHLAYYLGKHPEESLRIAKLTLADNEDQWRIALARAGRELGKIEAKLEKDKPAKAKAPAPKPQPKQVTSAPKPPAKVGGTRSAPVPDVHDEDTAQDYRTWERAREAQLRRK